MDCLIEFWTILKRLLIYTIPWKKKIIFACILILIGAISEVLGPVLINYFVKNITIQQDLNLTLSIILIILFIILQLISVFCNYFQSILFTNISVQIINKLRKNIMNSTLYQPIHYFDSQPIGTILSKITNDTEVIKELYDTVIPNLLRNIILMLIILLTMFALEWHMAIVSGLMIPLIIIIMTLYQYYSTPFLRKIRYYNAIINNKFNESIKGINIIQQFRQQYRFEKEIKKISDLYYKERIKILKLDSFLLRPLLSLVSSLILCAFIIIFSSFPIGILEIGVLYAFITYLSRLSEPLITITVQQSILQQAIVAGERVFNIIDLPKQKYGNNKESFTSGTINITNLDFCYKNNVKNTLYNINIDIQSKNFIALVGHTGCGKSTLANLLMGFYEIKHGQIYLDNKPINSIDHDILRKNILMVEQEPIILADTFFENIALGRKISEKNIWKILKTVHLTSLVLSMPKGIYSPLGEEGDILSIGQKQLLAIARILVTRPKILILDEATANIDSETEQKIQKTLLSIQKYSTLIVIAHRMSTIVKADRIIVLEKGRMIESGTHDQLLKKRGSYWEIFQFQSFYN
ncbi:SmdB family multidrug efflux ABC transporter permease/ATP-binding protein [Buchnera aphidicola]|uniref:SmdB family multidrug efflux ABC transporter permease/ATP-binding protein n=1 Tax=Buchnera aphidicola TaxID=9 RepID=UPI003464DCE1